MFVQAEHLGFEALFPEQFCNIMGQLRAAGLRAVVSGNQGYFHQSSSFREFDIRFENLFVIIAGPFKFEHSLSVSC